LDGGEVSRIGKTTLYRKLKEYEIIFLIPAQHFLVVSARVNS